MDSTIVTCLSPQGSLMLGEHNPSLPLTAMCIADAAAQKK